MKIAIIGAGNIGNTLAKSLSRAGHHIFLNTGNLHKHSIKNLTQYHANISTHTIAGEAQAAEAIIISAPRPCPGNYRKPWRDKRQNHYRCYQFGLRQTGNLPECQCEALKDLTGCPYLVKCFNTTGFENKENPFYNGEGVDMFVGGNSTRASNIAIQFSKDIGFAICHDLGGDDKIALLEKLAMFWINLAILQKQGRNIAFKMVKR